MIAAVEHEAKLSAPTSEAGKLQRMCLERIRQHEAEGTLPTSCTFIYYELKAQLAPRINRKTGEPAKRTWRQDVSDALLVLREAGIVPWQWVKDEKCQLTSWRSARSVYEYAIESIEMARIDPWRGKAPMIICESHSLAGVLMKIACEYLAEIISTSGQTKGVLQTDVIPALRPMHRIGYLGDLNNAGADIEANTRRVLEKEFGPLDWERLLLTDRQVRKYRLQPKETLDARFRATPEDRANGGRVSDSWEAEALGQGRIQQFLRDWLDAQIPEPIQRVLVREARQRREVEQALKRALGRKGGRHE